MKIYAIEFFGSTGYHVDSHYLTKDLAIKALKKIVDDIKTRRPDIIKDEPECFEFTNYNMLSKVKYIIVEIHVFDYYDKI